MNFCEKCNIACDDEYCPKCGSGRLRAVNDDDFCFVAKVERVFGEGLKVCLENEKIECVLLPYGTGFYSKLALPLESYLLYVRYENLEYVKGFLEE